VCGDARGRRRRGRLRASAHDVVDGVRRQADVVWYTRVQEGGTFFTKGTLLKVLFTLLGNGDKAT
jgi:hypothetical protein